eukprot:CAMPEP_0114576098 /NCGR_PEP_ID=MMETSP0125-20121206/887_1 /TAXON_ID=485358 ORGANISM="Aristerostoma sp., Strain ATCC 50986" /NCGR_SAMPLE_ID=MMETSP0125 /ASSEMBLY_ACC=CAM_ASM_000245 /LENGTH=237 /DNA_ID=CAMNT_0001764327 /DNA_START=617 /DNA_END=1328 /DNA_ORIENTATION=-
MKSFLKGNPDLSLSFNDDLVIGKGNSYGINKYGFTIDDCNFHQNVDISTFDNTKSVKIKPPEGEFIVMNYRASGDFNAPFRIFPYFEEPTNYRTDLILKIKATFPKENSANGIVIKCPIPTQVSTVHTELTKGVTGQEAEYSQSGNIVVWKIKKMQGGSEQSLKIKINLQVSNQDSQVRKQIGPVQMNFNVPMFNITNLSVKTQESMNSQITPQKMPLKDGSDTSLNPIHTCADYER